MTTYILKLLLEIIHFNLYKFFVNFRITGGVRGTEMKYNHLTETSHRVISGNTNRGTIFE